MSLGSRPDQRSEATGALIAVVSQLHPEARRKLRVVAAENGYNTAEAIRSILYRHFGLSHLPVVLGGAKTATVGSLPTS